MRIIIFVVVFLHRITLSFFFFVVVVVLNIAYILNESKKWHFVFKEVLDYITHTLQHGWIWKQLFFLRINQFYFYQKKNKTHTQTQLTTELYTWFSERFFFAWPCIPTCHVQYPILWNFVSKFLILFIFHFSNINSFIFSTKLVLPNALNMFLFNKNKKKIHFTNFISSFISLSTKHIVNEWQKKICIIFFN